MEIHIFTCNKYLDLRAICIIELFESSHYLVLVAVARALGLVLRPLAVLAGALVTRVRSASVAGSHAGFRGRSERDRGRDRFLHRRVRLRHRGLGGLREFLHEREYVSYTLDEGAFTRA